MSTEFDFKKIILYLSGIALALFYLVYMPWTYSSAMAGAMDPAVLWFYYFVLVLGLLFPLYYSIGREAAAWIILGLAIILNSVVWMLIETTQAAAAVMALIVGVLFFLGPILEPRMGNWELIKNIFHILKGLFIVLAAGFYSGWVLDDFIGNTSFNHIMPSFIFIGGGLTVVFGILLLAYGLFKLMKTYISGAVGDFFGELVKVFYILMVLVFLLGITFNVATYAPLAAALDPWSAATFPTSIAFFRDMYYTGASTLGSILLIILFIYGMHQVVEKFEQ